MIANLLRRQIFLSSFILKLSSVYIPTVLILFVGLSSCKKDVVATPEEPISYKYLHISHTRGPSDYLMVDGVETIDYSKYDVLMLGGDLLVSTTTFAAGMEKVDSLFDVGNPNTLWSIGNHDDINPAMIPLYTNRPFHYSYHKNGITYLVLDTENDFCNISNDQLALFNAVVDTIQESSHLIVMTHKMIWMSGNNILEPLANSTANGGLGLETWEINPNNFYDDLYWSLLEVQERGVQVICIGGDIGFNTSEFQFRFDSGIHLLASGVSYTETINKALVFEHYPTIRQLTWEYVELKDL